MDKKISKITRGLMTVLTVILIALFLTIMVLVSKIQGTARVVNYAGLVLSRKDAAYYQTRGCKRTAG